MKVHQQSNARKFICRMVNSTNCCIPSENGLGMGAGVTSSRDVWLSLYERMSTVAEFLCNLWTIINIAKQMSESFSQCTEYIWTSDLSSVRRTLQRVMLDYIQESARRPDRQSHYHLKTWIDYVWFPNKSSETLVEYNQSSSGSHGCSSFTCVATALPCRRKLQAC
jgi:hypothetical protein